MLMYFMHTSCVCGYSIPHCLMWCIWQERNARTFHGCVVCTNNCGFETPSDHNIILVDAGHGTYPFCNLLELWIIVISDLHYVVHILPVYLMHFF